MAVKSGFFVGQIGAKIQLDTSDDATLLAAATVKRIKYKTPETGTTGYWEAALEGTKLTYTTTAATDLPESGVYKLQVFLSQLPNWAAHGSIASVEVEEPIP